MATIMSQDKGLLVKLSSASINLNATMAQLYTAVTRYLEIDERKSEAAYYQSLIAAYSIENKEAESISELFMGVSDETDNIRIDFNGNINE